MLCDAAPAAPAPAAPAAAPAQQSGFGMMVPMLLILAIFYFMMVRPQQRKEKERRQMIEELRAGAKIIFAGGIIGTIIEATEKTFKVKVQCLAVHIFGKLCRNDHHPLPPVPLKYKCASANWELNL